MIKRLHWFVLASLFICFAGDGRSADLQGYNKYCNARYGFCIDYPSHFKMEPAPDNDDGRKLLDGKGFLMIASGINNANDDTLTTEMHSQSEDFDKVTYRTKGKNWFVLSGYKGSDILYVKTCVGEGAINHLYIQYPSRRKTEYEHMVTKVSRSFKPGDLRNAH
jgi:hypothetical protein